MNTEKGSSNLLVPKDIPTINSFILLIYELPEHFNSPDSNEHYLLISSIFYWNFLNSSSGRWKLLVLRSIYALLSADKEVLPISML